MSDPAVEAAQRAWESADRVGWVEFVRPNGSTTHIAYVHEDGSVYLPEGRDVVDETDFRLASSTDRFWPLPRPIDAAREALKPIRELHRPVKRYAHPDSGMDCLEDSKPWPCRTAKLIYTTEELEQ